MIAPSAEECCRSHKIEEDGNKRRGVCMICGATGPWWTWTQIPGPYGRDLFVFERDDVTVIRWGEMQDNEARLPEWALEALIAMRAKRTTKP